MRYRVVVVAIALGCVADGGGGPDDGGPPDGFPRGQDPRPYDDSDAPVPPCGMLAAVPPLGVGSTAWSSVGDVGVGPFTILASDGADAYVTTVGDYDARSGRLEIDVSITEITSGTFTLMLDDREGHGVQVAVRDATISLELLEDGVWRPQTVRRPSVRGGTFHVERIYNDLLSLGIDDGSTSSFQTMFASPAWLGTTRVTIGGVGGAVRGSIDAIRATGPGAEPCPTGAHDALAAR